MEHLELFQTNIINGSLRKLLKIMPDLNHVFLHRGLNHNFAKVSFSDFPLSMRLRSLLYLGSGNFEDVSGRIPEFTVEVEILGLRCNHSGLRLAKLGNLNKVFPKLRICFLGIEVLAVVSRILRIDTLEKLFITGVNEFQGSEISMASFEYW
jgi:hypothetical protein